MTDFVAPTTAPQSEAPAATDSTLSTSITPAENTINLYQPEIDQQAFNKAVEEQNAKKPKPFSITDYTPEQINRFIDEYAKNPTKASFDAFNVSTHLQFRQMAANFARVYGSGSPKAANRKDWAARVLGVPIEVVNASPEYAISEAQTQEFRQALEQGSLVADMMRNPEFVRLLTVKDINQFNRTKTVFARFFNGIDIGRLTHEYNELGNEFIELSRDGKEIPQELRNRWQDVRDELLDRQSYGDGAAAFIGNLFGSVGSSFYEAAPFAATGATVGVALEGVGAIPGAMVGLTAGLADDTIEQVRGTYYNELIAQGVEEAKAIQEAYAKGTGIGGAEAFADLLSGQLFGRSVRALRATLRATAMDTAAGLELKRAAQELGLNTIAGGAMGGIEAVGLNVALQDAGIKRETGEGVGKGILQGAFTNTIAGGILGSPSLIINGTRVLRSARKISQQKVLNETARNSDIVQSNPEAAAELLNQMVRNSGMRNVYISPEVLIQALNDHPDDAQNIRRTVPDLDAKIARAQETGGQVELDNGTWLAKIAPTEAGKTLDEYIRHAPDDFSERELQDEAKALDDDVKITIQNIAAEDAQVLARDTALEEIKADILQNLKNVGISNKSARQGANLYSAFFDAVAQRLGIDARQFYKDAALKFAYKARNNDEIKGNYSLNDHTIFLDEHSDASTVVHEGAHFFLDTLTRFSKLNHNLDNTMDIIFNWLGVTREQWDKLTLSEQRPYHEKFAKNWEQYLATTEAPSKPLAKLFTFFNDWISSVYRNTKSEGGQIPDDVRLVFDTLLATDEQMQALREAHVDEPLLRGEILNFLSDSERAEYDTAIEEHFQNIQAQLNAANVRQMALIRRKRDRLLGSLGNESRKLRKSYGLTASMNVRNSPSYRLLDLTNGGFIVDNGQIRQTGKLKINRASAAQFVDSPTLTRLGFKHVLTDKDSGISVEEAISYIGAEGQNIKNLLEQVATQPPLKQAISQEIDRLMLKNHSLIATAKDREELADMTLAQAGANKLYSMEISALLKGAVPARRINRVADAVAKRVFNTLRQNDVNERTFVSQERRCNRLAFKAMRHGDVAAAARHRYHALINRKMQKMAFDLKKEKTSAREIVSDLRRLETSKNHDVNWIIVAQAYAKKIGMYKRDINKEAVAAMQVSNPRAYTALQDLLNNMPDLQVRDMTVEQFHDAFIDLQGYVETARQEKKFILRGKAEDIQHAVDEMHKVMAREDLKDRKGKSEFGTTHAPTKAERQKFSLLSALNATKTVETLFEWIDGATRSSIQGAWTSRAFTPLREASTQGELALTDMRARLAQAFNKMNLKSVGKEPIIFKGYDFNANGEQGLAELAMFFLNCGTRDNYQKLLLGGRSRLKGSDPDTAHPWATLREDGTLDDTDAKEFVRGLIKSGRLGADFFNGIQDVLNEFAAIAPELQEARYQVEGKYFKEIPAEFQMNNVLQAELGMTLKGGYFPVVYDLDLSNFKMDRSVESLQVVNGDIFLPQANHSFFKERTASQLGGLSLNIGVVERALTKQIWYAKVQPTLTNVDKLLRQPQILADLERIAPGAKEDILQPWMLSIARKGALEPADMPFLVDKLAVLNNRATQTIMHWNFTNIAQQITGWITALPYVGTKNMLGGIAASLGDIGSGTLRREIEEMSPQMKLRWSRQDEKTGKMLDQALGLGLFQRLQKQSTRNAYIGQSLFQIVIDKAIWKGAYNDFIEKNPNATREQAVAYADSAVIKTQSSNRPEDRAAIQNLNNAWVKAFGMFFAYFTTMRNLQPAVAQMWSRSLGLKNSAPMQLAAYMAVLVVPMVLGEMISRTMRGQWAEDNEEFKTQLIQTLSGVALTAGLSAWVPYLGGYSAAWLRSKALGQDDVYVADTPFSSPGISLIESTFRNGKTLFNGTWESKDIMAFGQMLTALTGIALPAALARPVAGTYDMVEKNEFAPSALFSGSVPKDNQ